MKPVLFLTTLIISHSLSAEPPKLLLAKTWDESTDPTGWWISEKYDGVRGFWDGDTMRTRGGQVVFLPDYFYRELPRGMALDGELWLGRGKFEETLSIVRTERPDERWKEMHYVVFDAPKAKGTFEKRLAFLKTKLPEVSQHVWAARMWRCKGKAHLIAERDRIVKAGGEGLMIREPESVYEGKRSGTLLKVKTHDDAEATVIGHKPGKGKFAGMLGSLRVRTKEGKEFSIGTGFTNAQRKDPPPIGSVVTFRYRGFTRSGLPRFPSFWRMRLQE